MAFPIIPVVIAASIGGGAGFYSGSELSNAIKLALVAGAVTFVYFKVKS